MHRGLRIAVFLLFLMVAFWLILIHTRDDEEPSAEWVIKEVEILNRFIRIAKPFMEEAEKIEERAIPRKNGCPFLLSFIDMVEEMGRSIPDATRFIAEEAYRFIQTSDELKEKFAHLLKTLEQFASCNVLDFEKVTQPEQTERLCKAAGAVAEFTCGIGWILEYAKQEWKNGRKEEAVQIAARVYRICDLTVTSPYQPSSLLAIAGAGMQCEVLREFLEKWEPEEWDEEKKRAERRWEMLCEELVRRRYAGSNPKYAYGILAHYWLFKHGIPYWLRSFGASYLALAGWARESGVNIKKAGLTESKIQLARRLALEVLNTDNSPFYIIYKNCIFKGLLSDGE